jgi:hypothetical protein
MSNRFHVAGLACACLLSLSACGGLDKSVEERINAALPPPAAVLDAKAKLLAEAAAPKLGDAIETDFAARMKARALECSHGYTPSALSSDAGVREELKDKACFDAADRKLMDWLNQRRVGLLLSAPALRPIPANPPKQYTAGESISGVRYAEQAGVALLQGLKRTELVDLNDGRILRGWDGAGGGLSPNGRLYVGGKDAGTELYASEDGSLLARFDRVQPHEFHWLGQAGAVFMQQREGEAPRLVFVDFASGEQSSLPFGAYKLNGVVARAGMTDRYLLLGNDRVGELALTHSAQGWHAGLMSERILSGAEPWHAGASVRTVDGKYLVGGMDTLKLLDLASMESRQLAIAPMRLTGATPMPDPDQLLMHGIVRRSEADSESFLYSISRNTLAPVDRTQFVDARFEYVPSLRRNAVIHGSQLLLLDGVAAAEPVRMDDYLQQRELAGEGLARANPGMFDALGFRDRNWAPDRPIVRPAGGLGGPALGPLEELGKTAEVEAIGIYEPRARDGSVQVHVRESERPLILVLSAYEDTKWVITLEPGARLAAVLYGGYEEAQLFGGGDAKQFRLGRTYAYKRESDEFARLDEEVRRWTGRPIGRFNGKYAGDTFYVGR